MSEQVQHDYILEKANEINGDKSFQNISDH